MGEKWTLHWSGISMYARCGEQYRRRYVEGEKIPPGIALIIGAATHKSVEADLKRKIETGSLAPVDELRSVARDYVRGQFASGDYALSQEERLEKNAAAWAEEGVDTAVALGTLHHKELAPVIQPIAVERQWRIELPGFPCDLAGTTDIEEQVRIRDTKTSARSPSKDEADGSDQLTLYGMERQISTGVAPEEYVLDALVKTKVPKAVSLVTHRDQDDFTVLLRRIEAVVGAIEKGVFTPCDRSHWLCTPKFCGFHQTCPYQRGRVAVAVGGVKGEGA